MMRSDNHLDLADASRQAGIPSGSDHPVPAWRGAVAPLTAAEQQELRGALRDPENCSDRAQGLLSRFLLAEVIGHVFTSLSLDELLQRLVTLAASALEAERGTIFLIDRERAELVSRVALGEGVGEIRIAMDTGIAGAVIQSGRTDIVDDAYADSRFNPTVDERTGYHTHSLIAAPLRKGDGEIIGAFEVINKRQRKFHPADRALLEAIASQAASALDHARAFERERHERLRDRKLLELSEEISFELDLDRLLLKIVAVSAELLDAERATLFIHDPATGELWSRATAGGEVEEIRIRSDFGVAGTCFTTGQPINVADVHVDSRFDPAVDARTGFTTRNLLAIAVNNRAGNPTAVLEVLNKRSGAFTSADERRLQAFATHAGLALQNAQLFADILALKNYAESLVRPLSEGVIALDRDFCIRHLNEAARKMLALAPEETPHDSIIGRWGNANPWLAESLDYVLRTGGADYRHDAVLALDRSEVVTNVNATVAAVRDGEGAVAGFTVILQDISRRMRVHATISRYIAKEFADRILETGGAGATSSVEHATMLFSDIRRFTTLAEALSPQATVEMLNEYFADMAELVRKHGGVLDKYIGDAVMAVFGAPVASSSDADAAVRAANDMICGLRDLNLRRAGRGARPLEIGVGLATGEIVMGPVGSPDRKNYTVIGDSVNLAARLEGANKLYGTSVLIADTTVERLKSPFRLRSIDLIRVKGKTKPTEIFQTLDHQPVEILAVLDRVLPAFRQGIAYYRARKWSRALACFAEVIKAVPNDGPAWVYTDRCLHYRDHPPPDYWDGVWTMKSK